MTVLVTGAAGFVGRTLVDPRLEAIVRSWSLRLDDAAAREDWDWRLELDLDEIARRFGSAA